MALEHAYSFEGTAPRAAVRDALAGLTADDLTEKSPVTAGGTELAVTVGEHDGEEVLLVREEGHGGEWSKTSERAVRTAVKAVDAITDMVASSGGYEE